MPNVFQELEKNKNYIQGKLSYGKSYDIMVREFQIFYQNKARSAFLVFFDGMVNKDYINNSILLKSSSTFQNRTIDTSENIGDFFINHILTNYGVEKKENFDEIIDGVCYGSVAIFLEDFSSCLLCDMIKFEHRSIGEPYFESTVKGPQEGFNEVLSVNTALVRKNIRNPHLIIEKIEIGKRAKNVCVIMYIDNLTNQKMVKMIKNRIANISTDVILSTDTLTQYIETNTFSPIPQILPTERPDRVANFLMQGRCAILTNNSPIAGIVPTTIIDWLHSSEDGYLKAPFNMILKFIRIIAIISAIFLPAIYIATITYHMNIFPTSIAMSLIASRETVPLQFIAEILLMEAAFELLREAEMRVPTRIGPVVSVVGGLILGQLAVNADIICSFTMIIVGFSGIALYAIPNFFVSYGLRAMRYIFIILAFLNGYLALSLGVMIFLLSLTNTYSFGTRILPTFWIDKDKNVIKQIITTPIWKNEYRTYTNHAQDERAQPKISRRWLFHEKK